MTPSGLKIMEIQPLWTLTGISPHLKILKSLEKPFNVLRPIFYLKQAERLWIKGKIGEYGIQKTYECVTSVIRVVVCGNKKRSSTTITLRSSVYQPHFSAFITEPY